MGCLLGSCGSSTTGTSSQQTTTSSSSTANGGGGGGGVNKVTLSGAVSGDLTGVGISQCNALRTAGAQHQVVLAGNLAGKTYSVSLLFHGDSGTVVLGAAQAGDRNDALEVKQETPPVATGGIWSANPPNTLGQNGRGSATIKLDSGHPTGSAHGTLDPYNIAVGGPTLTIDATFSCPG